eukprot:1182918-Prorocentrum_minimum.AAC.5
MWSRALRTGPIAVRGQEPKLRGPVLARHRGDPLRSAWPRVFNKPHNIRCAIVVRIRVTTCTAKPPASESERNDMNGAKSKGFIGGPTPSGEKASGEKISGEKASGEKTSGEKASGEKASGEKTFSFFKGMTDTTSTKSVSSNDPFRGDPRVNHRLSFVIRCELCVGTGAMQSK